jgi:Rieske Fe-S protein
MRRGAIKKVYMTGLMLSFALGVLCVSSCKKEKQTVPNVVVDIRMYSADPSFLPLNPVGGWVYVNGGNRGILVYRKTLSDFMAFDRTCTYNAADPNEVVKVDPTSNVIAVDAHCGSRFEMTGGGVTQGPATIPLKYYQTTFDGQVLHIFN